MTKDNANEILTRNGYSVEHEADSVLVTHQDRPGLHQRFDDERQAVVRLGLR